MNKVVATTSTDYKDETSTRFCKVPYLMKKSSSEQAIGESLNMGE